MKAILISTRPQWVAAILDGIKKGEIRKGSALYKAINTLIREQGTAPVLLYCTKEKNFIWSYTKLNTFGVLFKDIEKQFKHFGTTIECDKAVEDFIRKHNKGCICSYGTHNQLLNGKVVAQFNATADLVEYYEVKLNDEWDCGYQAEDLCTGDICRETCLTDDELDKYLDAKDGTLVHINDLKIFDKPKEIRDFNVYSHKVDGIGYNGEEKTFRILKPLTRAPQNYCYIEV